MRRIWYKTKTQNTKTARLICPNRHIFASIVNIQVIIFKCWNQQLVIRRYSDGDKNAFAYWHDLLQLHMYITVNYRVIGNA